MDDTRLLEQLSAFISDHKRSLFEQLAMERTRHVSVVLEDLYQEHNASAVLRTCDLLGIQEVHAITTRNSFRPNREISLGSDKWLDVRQHAGGPEAIDRCVDALHAEGRSLVATTPHGDAFTPETIPLDRPLAFCFGTELQGLSGALLDRCDLHLRIPMFGFTESYNISVSAGIILYTVITRLRQSMIPHRLSAEEQHALRLRWTRAALHDADAIERRLRDTHIDDPDAR